MIAAEGIAASVFRRTGRIGNAVGGQLLEKAAQGCPVGLGKLKDLPGFRSFVFLFLVVIFLLGVIIVRVVVRYRGFGGSGFRLQLLRFCLKRM